MSSKIAPKFLPEVLIKIYAIAGLLSAAILIVNAAKRAGVIPTSNFTQLAAPVAQVAAIGFVIGVYMVISRKAGVLGAAGAVLSVTSLSGLVGVEFVLNLVFPYLDAGTITALTEGPLGIALTVVSMLFLLGTVALMSSLWLTSGAPKAAVALYAAGAIPIALRAVFPETVLQLALIGLAVAVTWLAIWLFRNASSQTPQGTSIGMPATRMTGN
ncbi:hypothetical protein [Arthrobacter monumenti]